MKAGISIFLVLSLHVADAQTIPAGVINWSDTKEENGSRNFLNGKSRFFDQFTVDAFTVKKGKKSNLNSLPENVEKLIIVREGVLTVTFGAKEIVLGPGGVLFSMPGEKVSYKNTGNETAVYYLLKFSSKAADMNRGKSNGGSFGINWDSVAVKDTEKGRYRQFFNRPVSTVGKYEMHVTSLNEGLSSHDPHTHPEEEIVLMLKGNTRMFIDGKYYDVAPGGIIYLASECSHAIQNSGKGQCEYFAFQWK